MSVPLVPGRRTVAGVALATVLLTAGCSAAEDAVNDAVAESRDAAQGAVDEQAVAEARDQLGEAVTGVRGLC